MNSHSRHEQILLELQRVTSSEEFRDAGKLQHLLTYTALETVAGRADRLTAASIAVDVFDSDTDSVGRQDTLAWVMTNQLRLKLERYYAGDGRRNALRLSMPVGSYAIHVEPGSQPSSFINDSAPVVPVLAIESMDCLSNIAEHRDFCVGFLSELCMTLAAGESFMLAAPGRFGHIDPCAHETKALIGQVPDADLLLACNLRWSGGKLKVFAQLVDAQTRSVIWIDDHELAWDGSDPLSLQIDAALFVARGILVSVHRVTATDWPGDRKRSLSCPTRGAADSNPPGQTGTCESGISKTDFRLSLIGTWQQVGQTWQRRSRPGSGSGDIGRPVC